MRIYVPEIDLTQVGVRQFLNILRVPKKMQTCSVVQIIAILIYPSEQTFGYDRVYQQIGQLFRFFHLSVAPLHI